ncbi:MAG: dienelactone hydrolase family protein, partial [Myxococcales bacterium]|nr:dienelactone hydrolase family protein [Myxococcales bacterium]
AGAHDDALTGLVDEETFKALHQLSEAETPTLHGQTIDLAGTKAYLSLPADASGPLPAVVVIHEWWGLNDHIRHWSDRLAADGYAALAVDLYGGQVATDPEGAMSLMKAVDQGKATAVLTAAHEFLAADPRVSAKKRGVIGWCFGGGWSLRQAIAHPDLDAAVIYYGHPVTDPAELGKIEASLLGVFANQDQAIPPASVDEFVSALEAAGKTIELYRYDAVHAFANPSSANYDQASAGDAWEHVRAFLARELK